MLAATYHPVLSRNFPLFYVLLPGYARDLPGLEVWKVYYRHIAASRLHELSVGDVVLDFAESLHLKMCPDCKILFRRFVDHRRREFQKKFEHLKDRERSA